MVRTPTQQEMVFAEAQRRRQQRDRNDLRVAEIDAELHRIVEQVGAKEIADRMGLDDETLIYHWLGRRGGRRPPVDLLDVCLDLDDTERLIAAVCRDRYKPPERVKRLSPEQEVQFLRRALQEFGAAGEQKLRSIEMAWPEVKP